MARRGSKLLEVRAVTWNVSSMARQSSEVVYALHIMKIDCCCTKTRGGRVEV